MKNIVNKQLNDICKVLENNLKAVVSGSLMMAAGIFAMVIPKNILLGRIFNKFGLFFVLTGAFTNQALIAAGYELLIVPLDLILLGILLSFWG